MKIAIRSKYSLYEFYMDTLLVIILFSGYLEHLRLWRLLSVALFALSLVTNSRQYKKLINRNFLFVLSALFLIFILLISSFVSDSTEYVVTNLKGLFYPICLILTYAGVAGYDIEKLYLYFKKRLIFINTVYVLNIYVLWRQVNGDGFMIKAAWLAKNSFYPDQCCGLFGYNGTHVLAFFSIFVLLLNISYIRNVKIKIIPIIYIVFCEFILLYCATFSDNMLLWLLSPLFLVLYFLLSINRGGERVNLNTATTKRFFQRLLIVVAVAVVIYVLVNIANVSDFINDITERANNALLFRNKRINGSNERLAIPLLALSHSWGWLFGFGLGTCQLKSPGSFGFSHFGLSSIGSIIYLCGIWAYIAFGMLYSSIAESIYIKDQNRGGIKNHALFFFIFVLLTTYTYVLTDIRLALLFMLLTSILQFANMNEDKSGEICMQR